MNDQDVRDLEQRTFEAYQELGRLYRKIRLLQRGIREDWATLPAHRAAAVRRIERLRDHLCELEAFFRHYGSPEAVRAWLEEGKGDEDGA